MAVCKRCGCAIPLGSKSCDMCATTAAIAPAQSVPSWTAPSTAGTPSAASALPTAAWPAPTASSPVSNPALAAKLAKARKDVRSAWQFIAVVGALAVLLGTIAELADIGPLLAYFDWYAVVEGFIFLGLAAWVRAGSLVGLGIAIVLYGLDTVAFFLTGHFAVIRILILVYLVRALGSANLLRTNGGLRAAQPAAADQSRAA
jgi:hypothetical protein